MRGVKEIAEVISPEKIFEAENTHKVGIVQEGAKVFITVNAGDKFLRQRIPRHILDSENENLFKLEIDKAMTKLAKRAIREGLFT